jgi:hypothetical protein
MTVQAYTDLFNEALTDLETNIAALTSLVVVTDPRNLAPPCAFIDAPRFDCWSSAIAKITFPVRLISLGPNNLDAHRNLLNLSAQLMNAGLGVVDGRPTVAIIGGVELPAYDLNISVQAQG